MSKWSRVSRWLTVMLVALTASSIAGCRDGGSGHDGGGTPVTAKVFTINISSNAPGKFAVTCDVRLSRTQGDKVIFRNKSGVDVSIEFIGLKNPDPQVLEKSPFEPDEVKPFTINNNASTLAKLTRGPNPPESGKVLVFEYLVNGTKPACDHRPGEPGITVGD